MLSIIEARRDGREHSGEELSFLAEAAAKGTVPDYQLAAWLMAAYLKPPSEQDTALLTRAMAGTGDRIDLTGLPKPWVDKHSTGGVGDKTSLVVLPILAACGLTIVKMSGRGLGITGGTVDKLESIPGFRMDLTPDEMKAQASRIGIAITGQSPNLAPADKALYALRDATATTESIPLITSSILSKKIAGGAEYLSLDVKCGSGAFMKNFKEARELAVWLKAIGEQCGLKVHAAITDMDQPLGSAVGNVYEVLEAWSVVNGEALSCPVERFRRLCLELCSQTLLFVGLAESEERATAMVSECLSSGRARDKFRKWFEAQGADCSFMDRGAAAFAEPSAVLEVVADEDGWISSLRADEVGETVVDLGGGRKRKEDSIDPLVAVFVHKIVGDQVARGETVMTVYAASEDAARVAQARLLQALEISKAIVQPSRLILEVI